MKRNYKVGDRVFWVFEPDGSIDSAIIKNIREDTTVDVNGKEFKYNLLLFDGNMFIEDYNCINPTDPQYIELFKKYTEQQKETEKIIQPIIDILLQHKQSVNDDTAIEDLFDIIKFKLKNLKTII